MMVRDACDWQWPYVLHQEVQSQERQANQQNAVRDDVARPHHIFPDVKYIDHGSSDRWGAMSIIS